jgi:hypothetical protein
VFFFGPPRFLLLFLAIFFLFPLFFYSPVFALLLGGAAVLFVVMGAARRGPGIEPGREPARPPKRVGGSRPFAEVRETAEKDLLALADAIRALDLDVEMPGAPAAARADYERALDHYDRAKEAFDRAQRPEDFEEMSREVDDGQHALAVARARLEGRPPPERRPPCFFDPRHGPSVRDVMWAPPGGAERPVPACAADAIRVEEGEEPHARRVRVRGRRVPYWEAPAYYGPWAGGFFAGGLLPGLLLGSALGGGVGAFGGWGVDEAMADAGEGGDGGDAGGDAGDYGDGDFGGGDFGGGDFGGGDFGGGDFGG